MSEAAASFPVESSAERSIEFDLADRSNGNAASSQFISFAIGGDQYGVDIMAVREIKGWTQIKQLPGQPGYVRGVIDLRGAIVPIIDLRCRFGGGLTETTPLHIVIIVQIESRLIGLLADRVLDIVSLDPSQLQRVPRVAEDARSDFLSGLTNVDGALIALIDLPSLVPSNNSEAA